MVELIEYTPGVLGSRIDDLERRTSSQELFDATKRWGRWGDDDDRGALNLLTPERVARAATLVRDGLSVPCGRPLATAPGRRQPQPGTAPHDPRR